MAVPIIRAGVVRELERLGWQIDADEPHVVEASDGGRTGVAVFFERGVPVEVAYGDGESFAHAEDYWEIAKLPAPEDVRGAFAE